MFTGRRLGSTPSMRWPSMTISPSRRILEAGEHAQQRGLAAARGPEQGEELAFGDVEVGVVDGDDGAAETLRRHCGSR